MRFQHVEELIFSKPWLITPSAHASIVRLFESKTKAFFRFEADDGSDAEASAFFVQREPASLDGNGIGHVHIKGVIGQGMSRIEKSCGNTDTKDVQTEISTLVSQGAKGLLLHIDSPGGTITGTRELAETVQAVALSIPVFVFSDSQLCSAAYWIASGATKIVTTETAEIGSIGVYMPWIDRSAQWEQEGVKADPVINTGGTFKAIGFGPSLSDTHRAQLQSQVDRIFGLFKSDVITARALNEAVVPDSALQGQVFLGLDALTNGLVDALGSKEDAYEMLFNEIDIPDEQPSPSSDSTEEATSTSASS